MIRTADLVALLYYFGFLPWQAALGHTVGAELGHPLLGILLALIVGLVPAYFFLTGFAFGVACATAWTLLEMFFLPRMLEGGTLVSERIISVGIATLALPYVLMLIGWLIYLTSRLKVRRFEKTVRGMPLEKLVAKLRWVWGSPGEVDDRQAFRRLRREHERAVPLMIDRYRATRKWEEKTALLHAFSRVRNKMGDAFLRGVLLSEEEFIVLYTAAEACGESGDPSCVPALGEFIKTQDDQILRIQGFEALGRIGTTEAIELIRRRLAVETDPSDVEAFIESAAEGAGLGRSTAAVPWLAEVVAREEGQVWRAAVRALSSIGSPQALEILSRVLDSASEPEVIRMALGIDPENQDSIPWLAGLLREHPNIEVRVRAAETLMGMRSADGARIAKEALSSEEAKPPHERDQQLLDQLSYYFLEASLE